LKGISASLNVKKFYIFVIVLWVGTPPKAHAAIRYKNPIAVQKTSQTEILEEDMPSLFF